MIGAMVYDLTDETRRRLEEARPQSAAAVRALGRPVAAFSAGMARDLDALRAFLMQRMYRHYKVNRMTVRAKRVVSDLFDEFASEPQILPPDWFEETDGPGGLRTQRVVGDYIAGMTDRFALREHQRLFDNDDSQL